MSRLRVSRFLTSLHFRASALFLALLGVVLGGYFLWIDATVSSPYDDEVEQNWYENLAEGQLDSLSERVASALASGAPTRPLVREMGERVAEFEAELLIFTPTGDLVSASGPDSLAQAVPHLDVELMLAMSLPDWDYDSYPVAEDIDAFENRIFDVGRLAAPDTTQPDLGFLVASYRPLIIDSAELAFGNTLMDRQTLLVKVLAGMLVWAALSALTVMAWTGRRVGRLTHSVEAFADGDMDRRVDDPSGDELGRLGRHFNRMAERLSEMVESLRRKEEFQRRLIANMSHDLRTPMSSLRGNAETLAEHFTRLKPDQRQRCLEAITGNVDHLERLIERMLVLSRFDAGQTLMRPEVFPLPELVDIVLQRCKALASADSFTLELEADDDLPCVKADPLHIAQVLQNLVENSLKHNDPPGRVVVSLRRVGPEVEVSVTDDGRGIAAEDLPRIFDRFYTGSTSRTRKPAAAAVGPLQQNSGLGLAISAKILTRHDRELTVRSVPGEGATFRFRLPAAADDGLAETAYGEG